jgi:succinate-semialdehyde dehydrogenase/glutarate-semialdehyde dehydrogenase
MSRLADEVEAGMITMNHLGLGRAEVPFGGTKESGYGTEGGSEALEPYLETRFISRMERA